MNMGNKTLQFVEVRGGDATIYFSFICATISYNKLEHHIRFETTETSWTFKDINFFLCCSFFSLVTPLVQDTLHLVILLIQATLPLGGTHLLHQDTHLLLVAILLAILLLLADIHLPQQEVIHQHQVQSYLFI